MIFPVFMIQSEADEPGAGPMCVSYPGGAFQLEPVDGDWLGGPGDSMYLYGTPGGTWTLEWSGGPAGYIYQQSGWNGAVGTGATFVQTDPPIDPEDPPSFESVLVFNGECEE